MFRPPIVAIFRKVFIEGILKRRSKKFLNITCLGSSFKIYVRT